MTSLYKVSNPNANGTMCLAEGVEKGFHFRVLNTLTSFLPSFCSVRDRR